MEKEALPVGSPDMMNGYGSVGHDVIATNKVMASKLSIVCKADLISLSNEKEIKKSEALIDGFLKGEMTVSYSRCMD